MAGVYSFYYKASRGIRAPLVLNWFESYNQDCFLDNTSGTISHEKRDDKNEHDRYII